MSSGPHERVHRRLRSPSTRYRPVARLAVGGMAEVWSGEAVLEGARSSPSRSSASSRRWATRCS